MKTIPLTRGYVAAVDDEDYARLSVYRWRAAVVRAGLVYATRNASPSEISSGFPALVYMHREVLGLILDSARQVDHKNHDELDNRRENLRACSGSQNLANMRKTRGSSKWKGVTWNKEKGRWQAQIQVDGLQITLGRFRDEDEAGRTYDHAAFEAWGEFAHLNFPLRP